MKSSLKSLTLFLAATLTLSGAFIALAQSDDDHVEEYTEEQIAEGYQIFIDNGCVACHGLNGEGTNTGPALPGHSSMRIRRQLRAPLGIMPVFSPDEVSSGDLELIIAYITSLEGNHMHMEASVVKDAVSFYHWLALSKLEVEDVDATIHYVEHISSFVVGEHLTRMQQVLAALQAGAIEPATLMLNDMLADVDRPLDMEEPDAARLHLQLAYSSASAGLADETIHHTEHYMELTPEGDHEHLEEILEQFNTVIQNAEHELGTILGDAAMMDMDMDMEGDDGHTSMGADDHADGDDHDDDGDGHDDGDDHND